MGRRKTTILRVLKPIVAGLALAYLATAFVDKPAPVHFMPENPYAAKQEIVAPQDELVTERNIMKLGSPLSMTPDTADAVPTENPLAALEDMPDEPAVQEGADASEAGLPPEIRQDVDVEPVETKEPTATD